MQIYDSILVQKIIQLALEEDLPAGDVTSMLTIPEDCAATGRVVARQEMIVCGIGLIKPIIRQAACKLSVELLVRDGDAVQKGTVLAELSGPASSILLVERTLLNFMQRLSGVATHTAEIVKQAPEIEILDTRKTTPGMRVLEKYAVALGGGRNHRMSLSDMVLIKDNHIEANAGDIQQILRTVKSRKPAYMPVEIEVDDLEQLELVLDEGVDIVMLDNMDDSQLKLALEMIKKAPHQPLVEVSGGISQERFQILRQIGIKRVSMGALTTRARNVDIALDLILSDWQ